MVEREREQPPDVASYKGTNSVTRASPLFSSVQSLRRVRLFATPWITACQASLSITRSRSLLKLMSIKSVMPSSHLILCRPLLLLPPIPLSIKVFSNESTLCMRWPKHWSFSFSKHWPNFSLDTKLYNDRGCSYNARLEKANWTVNHALLEREIS